MKYPIVADVRHLIARAYDVESPGGMAYRGSFLVDQKGIVRHQVVNDLPLGRNVEPKELGATALYLLGEASNGVTGETVHVDCGYSIVGL